MRVLFPTGERNCRTVGAPRPRRCPLDATPSCREASPCRVQLQRLSLRSSGYGCPLPVLDERLQAHEEHRPLRAAVMHELDPAAFQPRCEKRTTVSPPSRSSRRSSNVSVVPITPPRPRGTATPRADRARARRPSWTGRPGRTESARWRPRSAPPWRPASTSRRGRPAW